MKKPLVISISIFILVSDVLMSQVGKILIFLRMEKNVLVSNMSAPEQAL